jgi:hypothetical protein
VKCVQLLLLLLLLVLLLSGSCGHQLHCTAKKWRRHGHMHRTIIDKCLTQQSLFIVVDE